MKALIASLLLIISFSGSPSTITGNVMYSGYKEWKKEVKTNPAEASLFMGYVRGVGDILIMTKSICVSNGVTGGQLFDIVGKSLEDNPENRDSSASALITIILGDTFPC